jgi:hypothetical protein
LTVAARNSAKKSAKPRGKGVPFAKGGDPRQGRGPAPGAPNAGRPPDEFKAMLAGLASWDVTLGSIAAILADPSHPHFVKALEYVSDRGYTPNATTGELTVRLVRQPVTPPTE